MTRGQMRVVERLREGPLPTHRFREVELASTGSLKVLVSRLRSQGFDIRIERKTPYEDRRYYLGHYVLAQEPRR
jgi:hypothetical protein